MANESPSRPATKKQLDYLRDLGVRSEEPLTRTEASRLIEAALKRQRMPGQPSADQLELLQLLGGAPLTGATRGEVANQIDDLLEARGLLEYSREYVSSVEMWFSLEQLEAEPSPSEFLRILDAAKAIGEGKGARAREPLEHAMRRILGKGFGPEGTFSPSTHGASVARAPRDKKRSSSVPAFLVLCLLVWIVWRYVL